MATLQSVNPFTNQVVAEYALYSDSQIDAILGRSSQIFPVWSKVPVSERATLLRKLAQQLITQKVELSRLITVEMGKVLREAEAEIEKCAWVCNYYADNAEEFLAIKSVQTQYSKSYVAFNPLGTILAIMPWNFPFWQVFRAAAPIISAGNTMVLKHASNVTSCALAIDKIFQETGFPEGVLSTVLIRGSETAKIIADRRIAGVTITGSTPAGQSVAMTAGQNLKKTVLELGGSDPYLILEDADLSLAVDKCTTGRLINAGQSCIGAKRFIVMEKVYEPFLELFTQKMKSATTGDPTAPNTTYGPLANHTFHKELHQQVLQSIHKGAKLVLGGEIIESTKPLYPPTILTEVKPGMPAYDEELFGPVAAVIIAKTEEEAITLANNTMFGLGAAVFSKDIARATFIAEQKLQAGCCFVNDFVKSDPRLPFGGIKMSGYGRELSLWGMHEFVNIKTVVVA